MFSLVSMHDDDEQLSGSGLEPIPAGRHDRSEPRLIPWEKIVKHKKKFLKNGYVPLYFDNYHVFEPNL